MATPQFLPVPFLAHTSTLLMSSLAARTAWFLSLALALIAVASSAHAVDQPARVQVKQTGRLGNTWTLEVSIPEPGFDTLPNGRKQLVPLVEQRSTADVLAPIALGILAERGASVEIVSMDVHSIEVSGLVSITRSRDIADDGKPGPTRSLALSEAVHQGIGFAAIEYVGRMRGRGTSGLVLGVYDVSGSTLRYTRKIVVKITDRSAPVTASPITDLAEPFRVSAQQLKARLAPSQGRKVQAVGDLEQRAGIQSADGLVYRMNVRTEGIYHINYEDLRKFGIDPATVDVATLRVINRGQQTPIYIFDHHDGHFDPGDYFEFFGSAKGYDGPGTFGDFRYDPDTRDNVYYLVWGTYSPIPAGGLQRIVEESGEIRTADRSRFTDLADASFPAQIHYELNDPTGFDNLEITDINQRSELRDHNFMAILAGGESRTFSTVVPYADVRSNRPLSLRVALHGLSHDDPGAVDAKGIGIPDVPNEHEVEVAMNNRSVLHGIWDSQVMKFLSTDTGSQRIGPPPTTALLARQPSPDGEIDPLNLTIWNRKDPTFLPARVRFGVNWWDLEYDRLYIAYEDKLTFHAPKYSTAGLYQFTLRGYSRSDISIYRKGISKITNPVFSENPTQPGSAKTVFQINVSSDADEFIAVTEDKKLKPYSYARDDFAKLRDAANRGEYLIITSAEHLPKGNKGSRVPLDDLLQHRIQTQHVSGKIIDVRNIYDEFRYGARSANAIKEFLKYAYEHWAEPPKYVLLVGVTHPGDGDIQSYLPVDQVPAPYIQAFQEGAAPADPWYGLVDGDDLVPDIAIGRLPSGSIDEDRAYVDKAIEYDADAARPGDWKDKLFLISIGIQFTDQANLLLTQNIPHRISVGRMQTHANEPYYGTDQTLVENINAGLNSVIYLGHGGNAVWADPIDTVGRPVLLPSDMPRLHNQGKYPIILSLTCFTAGYDHAEEGILRSFLLAKNSGAIAGFGTTGFGWAENDYLMGASVLPRVYDSIGGSYAERINAGKVEYLLRGAPGDLLPATLAYCYHFIGDPIVAPHPMTDEVSMTLGARNLRPGGAVQILGKSSMQTGEARIELVDPYYSPFVPNHVLEHVPIVGGQFSVTDNVPNTSIDAGAYRVLVSSPSNSSYAAATSDVTFNVNRVTELAYDPRPLPVGQDLTLSATVQAIQPISSVSGLIDIFTTDANGVVTQQPTRTLPMTLVGDRYVGTIPRALLGAGDRVASSIRLDLGSSVLYSDTITITVGAAADPSVWKDANHRALLGGYRMTPAGLVWSVPVYNWGATDAVQSRVSLLNVMSGSPVQLGASTIDIQAHGRNVATIPVQSASLDSALYVLAIAPQSGSASQVLRDSVTVNDTTTLLNIQPAALGYARTVGTTLDGVTSSLGIFNSGEVSLELPAGALGNVETAVLRLSRGYDAITTTQPDIHFGKLLASNSRRYTTMRVVEDSLGAVPLYPSQQGRATLTLTFDPNDTVLRAADSIFVYRLDDRSKLWTKLATERLAPDQVRAVVTNLGTFAVAYNTDTRPPVVDLAVEGQIFSNNGEVPPQPHIQCVIQDANGIDITPGKTTVKIDNRVLQPSEYVVVDSGRTTTTVNLRLEPSLSTGSHTITVQATDNNGNTNTPPKELSIHVSNEFSVQTLGSYPNPFTRDYMFIAYEIRGIAYADEVALDIYTVSGRRIRTLSFPNDDPSRSSGFLKGGTGVPTSLGYHEVWWDGRDDSLDEVANGPYYYVLRVKARNGSREVKGKFARVR